MGRSKGVILDADGSVLYNLFDEFEIAPPTVNPSNWARHQRHQRPKCIAIAAPPSRTTSRASS